LSSVIATSQAATKPTVQQPVRTADRRRAAGTQREPSQRRRPLLGAMGAANATLAALSLNPAGYVLHYRRTTHLAVQG
jgi:hypothetical protein